MEPASWLAELACRLRGGDQSDRAVHGYRYVLESQLRQEIGWGGTLALQEGQADLLALADRGDRLAVAREYVEILGRESARPDTRGRSRGLDDDPDL
jgi:hypothetical protein